MKNALLLATIILGVFAIGSACGRYDNGDAEKNAKIYANKIGAVVIDVAAEDSDNDGYVSVTMRDPSGDVFGVQCGTGYSRTMGCDSASSCKLDSGKSYHGR